MAKDTRGINLLPGKQANVLMQFLDWALNIGRTLIILTEVIALGTFLYRFSLDRQIIDLHDQINADILIIKSFKKVEDQSRNLQARLALTKQYDEQSNKIPNLFNAILDMGRGLVTFQTLAVTTEGIRLVVQSPSPEALKTFINNLKNNSEVTGISVDKVENKASEATIVITTTATRKAKPTPVQPFSGQAQPSAASQP